MRGFLLAAVVLAGLMVMPDEASANRWRRGYYGGFRSYYYPPARAYVAPRYYQRPYYNNYYYQGYRGGYRGYGWPRSYYYTPGYYYAPLYRSGIHWYW